MPVVYALSAKGAQERSAGNPTLPAELGEMLRQVDGQRTRTQLIASMRKSSLTAGGLRWLEASGYIQPTQPAALHSRLGPATQGNPLLAGESGFQAQGQGAEEVRDALSRFMVRSIQRWLGEGGYLYHRQIAFARSVDELLPHLNPLMDTIVARAGVEAGAEFADTAAFLMEPMSAEEQAAEPSLAGDY